MAKMRIIVFIDLKKVSIGFFYINVLNNYVFLRTLIFNRLLSSITIKTLYSFIAYKITIPASSTTCERIFSKIKLIKTTIRNLMTDDRLSDLCVLAVERDIDKFSDIHKNRRIMSK
jgi:hypothetical protein